MHCVVNEPTRQWLERKIKSEDPFLRIRSYLEALVACEKVCSGESHKAVTYKVHFGISKTSASHVPRGDVTPEYRQDTSCATFDS